MKVLVTGAAGQLGSQVCEFFQKQQAYDVLPCDREKLDITNLEQAIGISKNYQPDVIIHCAAYTAVDAAENDIDKAYKINAYGTRNMALAAEKVGAKLVYISTDYVFDGFSKLPYQEYDNTNPQTVYGKSKRAGEILVQSLSSRYFIVRTSWVYGINGSNFVKTMLELGREKPMLQVVNDQIGSPTYTVDLVDFLNEIIKTEKYGVYHASNKGSCSWYEFTQAIFKDAEDILGIKMTSKLEPCTTQQFPRPAPRPFNSVLDHMSIRANGLTDLRPWREGLQQFLKELIAY
ncbi:dTDP-4-dehydrorhamnose reductase [Paenibacillus jamilae]|uniref:dTDP-4-dehydrorhamnose reductase n=1 Tax=Paenibacillus TaxID=44249 RepID=UPI000E3E7AD9|nr:dTDP-4-dehydrorhamnose reductase [Paenibacillus jamilae]MDP9677240.1 dTDP-4-dehydrorhamnose reductase [Paenibacillus jamilae]RFT93832.1 dTDP-4-dehydrorhamnose reductase [Paenibacillus jamilae]